MIVFAIMFGCIIYKLRAPKYDGVDKTQTVINNLSTKIDEINNTVYTTTNEYMVNQIIKILPDTIVNKIVETKENDICNAKKNELISKLIPAKAKVNDNNMPWDCMADQKIQVGFSENDLYKNVYDSDPKIIIY